MSSNGNPEYSAFFAVMGASSAMVFSGNYSLFIKLFMNINLNRESGSCWALIFKYHFISNIALAYLVHRTRC